MTYKTKASINQYWETPKDFLDKLKAEFGDLFDPCPHNPTFDGLTIDWGVVSYCNPPYNDIANWIKKGYIEFQKGKTIIFLLPVRTDTRWFHNFILGKAEIRYLRGRLKFGDCGRSAPFPNMLVIYRNSV